MAEAYRTGAIGVQYFTFKGGIVGAQVLYDVYTYGIAAMMA
jgi:hypothetical protein